MGHTALKYASPKKNTLAQIGSSGLIGGTGCTHHASADTPAAKGLLPGMPYKKRSEERRVGKEC